jgi:hypothetical protein
MRRLVIIIEFLGVVNRNGQARHNAITKILLYIYALVASAVSMFNYIIAKESFYAFFNI